MSQTDDLTPAEMTIASKVQEGYTRTRGTRNRWSHVLRVLSQYALTDKDDHVTGFQPLKVREIALLTNLELSRHQVQGILSTLREHGFVTRQFGGMYGLTDAGVAYHMGKYRPTIGAGRYY